MRLGSRPAHRIPPSPTSIKTFPSLLAVVRYLGHLRTGLLSNARRNDRIYLLDHKPPRLDLIDPWEEVLFTRCQRQRYPSQGFISSPPSCFVSQDKCPQQKRHSEGLAMVPRLRVRCMASGMRIDQDYIGSGEAF